MHDLSGDSSQGPVGNTGLNTGYRPSRRCTRYIPVPVYNLNVEEPDPLAIVLQFRAREDGIARANKILLKWEALPAGWDGPIP
jgi:hypothetical protein